MSKTKTQPEKQSLSSILSLIALIIVFALFFAAKWCADTYGRIGFDAILYTLFSDLGGTSHYLVLDYVGESLIPSVAVACISWLVLFAIPKLKFLQRHHLAVWLCVLLCVCLLVHAAGITGLTEYVYDSIRSSAIYANEYVDPAEADITFPEEKRNLIYILLESMETSYMSKELGGAMEVNLIPELYDIARENVNFSHHDGVGGYHCITGANWTIGSIVSQTSGIPLKPPTANRNSYGVKDNTFLPGATSLMDILHEAGYYQALMVGSKSPFGGRKAYYTTHGVDTVYDIYTAYDDGIVPDGYYVWWGMEDLYLFEYARQELTEIAKGEQPFAFTMLTVDTHHVGGYQCAYCRPSVSGETYDQAISCGSRQVAQFLDWIQQQDFYENTTVVIVGDHESMDNAYFQRMTEPGYQRMVYNCFINAAAETENTANRTFAAVDLFPTTLAAIGCQIEGERLGFGTNLFSDRPTLAEEMGIDRFDDELSMKSSFYSKNFYSED